MNVIANIHLFNLFIPLLQQGAAKKVITLSSGYSDIELTRTWDVTLAPLYSASKAAMNMIVAKFSAQYRKEGILFLGLAPGQVETGQNDNGRKIPWGNAGVCADSFGVATEEQVARFGAMFGRVLPHYAPNFKGMLTTEQSVSLMRPLIERASVEGGYGGDFISQFGNKQWM